MRGEECRASCPQRGPGTGRAGTFVWAAEESFGGRRSPATPPSPAERWVVSPLPHVREELTHTHIAPRLGRKETKEIQTDIVQSISFRPSLQNTLPY